jgi:hypothetical protein
MHRKEVNERSPLRVLEHSIHGGLGRGNLGVVVARHGTGKTPFLVGVALDDLMRGRPVLHVCIDQSLDHARSFYDEIFIDLAHAEALEDVWKVRLDVERARRIYSYDRPSFSIGRIREALAFERQFTDFQPAAIIIDGLQFETLTPGDLAELRAIARGADAELWMSAVTHRELQRNARGVPEPVAHLEGSIDVILGMRHDGRAVHVSLLKDHDSPEVSELRLALDPTTMLLVEER